MSIGNHRTILLVEDNPEDYEATKRALRKAGLGNPLMRCEDGDQALDYLFRRGAYSDPATAPRPAIILLDLNMPGTDGYEVLRQIKLDDDLKAIPVIVLTTSSDERDIEVCYRAGANSFVTKPVSLDGLFQSIQRLKDFWFEIAVYPKTHEAP